MIQFNEESGEYELPAEARMQLKAVGDQLGMNINSMVEMSRQGAKMKDIKMQLSGSMFSEEELDGIANMAKVKDGEFKVDIFDPETGKKMEKSIEELSAGDVEMLLKPPPTEEEYMQQMVTNSMTTNELLKGLQDKAKFSFMSEIGDVYQLQEEAFGSVIESVRNFDEALLQVTKDANVGDSLKILAGATDKQIQATIKTIDAASDTTVKTVETFFKQDFSKMYEEWGDNFFDNLNKLTKDGFEKLTENLEYQLLKEFPESEEIRKKEEKKVEKIFEGNTGNNNSTAFNYYPNQNTNTINGKFDVNVNVNGLNNIPDDQYGNIGMIMKKVINDAFPAMFNRINSNGGSPDGGSQSQNGKGYEQNLGSFDINFVG